MLYERNLDRNRRLVDGFLGGVVIVGVLLLAGNALASCDDSEGGSHGMSASPEHFQVAEAPDPKTSINLGAVMLNSANPNVQ